MTATFTGSATHLTWDDLSPGMVYEVWRSTDPYLNPDDGTATRVTRIVPVRRELLPDPQARFFTRQQVKKYMYSADWDAAAKRLAGEDTV